MEKSWLCAAKLQLGLAHRTVRCPKLTDGEPVALENRRSCTTIIHRTVRWCTGLSGESTAPATNGHPRDQRATRGPLQWSTGGTGQCPVCQPASRSNGRLRPIWKEIVHKDMNCGCLVVHRTVRCTTQQKAGIAFQVGLQRLLAALGL
jgi:hypothetical protein